MTWWQLALLAGVTYRLTRLAGWDDLTHPLRVIVTGMGDSEHHAAAERIDQLIDAGVDPWSGIVIGGEGAWDPPVGRGRFYLSRMIRCPWCMGFWMSLAVAIVAAQAGLCSWGWMPALAGTLSVAVGLTAKHLDA